LVVVSASLLSPCRCFCPYLCLWTIIRWSTCNTVSRFVLIEYWSTCSDTIRFVEMPFCNRTLMPLGGSYPSLYPLASIWFVFLVVLVVLVSVPSIDHLSEFFQSFDSYLGSVLLFIFIVCIRCVSPFPPSPIIGIKLLLVRIIFLFLLCVIVVDMVPSSVVFIMTISSGIGNVRVQVLC